MWQFQADLARALALSLESHQEEQQRSGKVVQLPATPQQTGNSLACGLYCVLISVASRIGLQAVGRSSGLCEIYRECVDQTTNCGSCQVFWCQQAELAIKPSSDSYLLWSGATVCGLLGGQF